MNPPPVGLFSSKYPLRKPTWFSFPPTVVKRVVNNKFCCSKTCWFDNNKTLHDLPVKDETKFRLEVRFHKRFCYLIIAVRSRWSKVRPCFSIFRHLEHHFWQTVTVTLPLHVQLYKFCTFETAFSTDRALGIYLCVNEAFLLHDLLAGIFR